MIFKKEFADASIDRDHSMISLVNVVFLLLAFFVIVGQIQQSQPDHVQLPESVSESTQQEFQLLVIVNTAKQVYLNGELVSLGELTKHVAEYTDETVGDLTIRTMVRADANLPARDLQQVLKHLRTAGLSRVSLATLST